MATRPHDQISTATVKSVDRSEEAIREGKGGFYRSTLHDMTGPKRVVKCGLNAVKHNFTRCNNGCLITSYLLIAASNMVVVATGKCEKATG
ncbi:hypothetical protein YC2023_124274 [Brassica napus]